MQGVSEGWLQPRIVCFFCGQQNRQKMLLHHLTSSIILWSRNRQKMLSALSVISHRHTNGMKRRMMIMMTWWQSKWHWQWRRDLPKWGDLVWVKHQSVQVLQGGEVGGHCDRVARQVDVLEVNILKRFFWVKFQPQSELLVPGWGSPWPWCCCWRGWATSAGWCPSSPRSWPGCSRRGQEPGLKFLLIMIMGPANLQKNGKQRGMQSVW